MHMHTTVVIAGPFPPPVHGVSAVLEAVATELQSRRGIKVVRADLSALGSGLRYHFTRWRRAVSAIGILVMWAHGRRNLYLAVAGGLGNVYCLALAAVARALRYRIYLDHHSFQYLDCQSIWIRALTYICGKNTNHCVLCPRMGTLLTRQYPRVGAVHVVSNAARVEPYSAHPEPHRGSLVLGHLSNLSQKKGLSIVLELFSTLHSQNVDVRLELGGPATGDDLWEIQSAVAANRGRITYRGPIYGQDKLRYLRSLDVFCFPTKYENEAQPLVLFEALSCGGVIVAFGRGCICEDIAEEMGLVVPPGRDFIATVLPVIRRWAVNRSEMELARARAWASYSVLNREASVHLRNWLDCASSRIGSQEEGSPG
jgi:glycosyltransferase involved in cell wall biosynthesis